MLICSYVFNDFRFKIVFSTYTKKSLYPDDYRTANSIDLSTPSCGEEPSCLPKGIVLRVSTDTSSFTHYLTIHNM